MVRKNWLRRLGAACGLAVTFSLAAASGQSAERAPFVVPEMTPQRTDVKAVEHVDGEGQVPFYAPRGARGGRGGEAITEVQKPLDPAESLKHFVTPKGFHLELFASEQELGGKPIFINWDERGRLWTCQTIDYPNELKPENTGRDRIHVSEDTNGDGKADKFTVFAEGLSIPTALIFHNGGVVVQNGTETLWLKDTNGDGKADERVVLITGWAMNDTHGGVSNFRMGLDNWFWAMQGYNNSRPVVAATGERLPAFRQGFWRFKLDDSSPPKVTGFEFLRSTNNNTWGLGISEEGIIFGSTANNCPSVYMPVPNRYYEMVKGWGPSVLAMIADSNAFKALSTKVRQVDWHNGYTAGAGHALYTARNYPEQWWNRTAFVCEPTGKLVGTFVITEMGSDYKDTNPFNLVASDDEWTAPIMAEVGPDGNVWILDWYNFVVQHNPTPRGFQTGRGNAYESPLRDKLHGRVYRLVYDGPGSKPEQNKIVSLEGANAASLVAALKHPNMLVRLHAQRLLREKKDVSIAPQLLALVADQSTDSIGLNVGAMHALWTLDGLGLCTAEHPEVVAGIKKAFSHPARGVRKNAVQVFPVALMNKENEEAIRKLVNDADSQVRLSALLRLADAGASAVAGNLSAESVQKPEITGERWLRDALTSAAAADAQTFLSTVGRNAQGQPQAVPTAMLETVSRVAQHFARSNPTAEQVDKLIAVWPKTSPEVVGATIQGIAAGWPRGTKITLAAASGETLKSLLTTLPRESKGQLISLSTPWNAPALQQYAEEILSAMRTTINNAAAPTPERLAAVNQLLGIRADDEQVVSTLLKTVTPQADPDWAVGVLEAFKSSTAPNLGAQLVELLPRLTPGLRESALSTMLARPETTTELLTAIEGGKVRASDLSLLQQRALTEHPNRQIATRARPLLANSGGLPNPDRQRVILEYMSVAEATGNAELGKAVFVKNCAKCHQHGSIGEHIGPNLTGFGVHPKTEILIHVLDPSRSVESNYRTYTAATDTGRVYTGMMAAESRTSIELFDAEGKRNTLQRENIEELIASTKSLMPEGFEKQVTREEFTNLLEFLTTKGPYLPLDLRQAVTVVSTKRNFSGEDDRERIAFEDYKPKTVGAVPFVLIDPQGERNPNIIMLYSTNGTIPPTLPRRAITPVKTKGKALHILGGIGGWAFPYSSEKTVSMTVVFNYADGTTQRYELRNGEHIADYLRKSEVPGSQWVFEATGGRQVRYIKVPIEKPDQIIDTVELVKGPDQTSPIVFAMTVELP